jgi:acetoin utilization deacetylase AcuC-like enzyme
LYVSLHQFPFYPGTGAADETGAGEGTGYTLNVPLSAGATDAVYESAFHEIVVPALGKFAPELVLVSAGFDAHVRDPLASMSVTEEGYARMARALTSVACESAGGRIALLLEGGYDLAALEGSLAASLYAMAAPESAAGELSETAPIVDSTHRDELLLARRIARQKWA